MRILALSDLHSDETLLERIPELMGRTAPDAVVFLGDFTNWGPLSYAKDALKCVGRVKAYGIFGNADSKEVRALVEESGFGIHLKVAELGEGWSIAGFGGSRASIGTPNEFSEEEIYRGLSGLAMGPKTILATHSPPYSVDGLDSPRPGIHAGSTAIRRIIEEKQPALSLCGHIHERQGQAKIGKTLVVKVGAAQCGQAALVEIGGNINAQFLEF